MLITNWNDKTITANNWNFTCQPIEKERIQKDAYIEVSCDCYVSGRYEIQVLLTYSANKNDCDWLFYSDTDEYPNLDIVHIWNECVRGATEIAEYYDIELYISDTINTEWWNRQK